MQLPTEVNCEASFQPSLVNVVQCKVRGRHLVGIQEHDELSLNVKIGSVAVVTSPITTDLTARTIDNNNVQNEKM